ncbi:ParB/RepB/Spo0J family partition protein [Rarobacter faecitabidus]|uniref:ParB/RepB/Spo0J family partition protein n=1 Tax=Rarobacter faecitabidus TaxID=13243 RepID=UPI001476D30D|nr:ParB/RepB/Spo0J family partition protein [Rarobacter faecitabidus]
MGTATKETVTGAKSPARKGKARASVPAVEEISAESTPVAGSLLGDLPAGARLVPVDQLRPHPSNPRREVGDVSELADSIREHGIRQNLLAVPDPGDEARFRLVIGHRRHAAAVVAGLAEVPVVIDPTLSEADQLELMLVENIQRSDLTAVEEADGFQGLLDLGLSQDQVAKRVGRSQSHVSNRIKLIGLPEKAREAVHARTLTLAQAEAIADVEDIPGATAALDEALNGDASNVSFVVSRLQLFRTRLESATEVLDDLEALGVTVIREYMSTQPPGRLFAYAYNSHPDTFAALVPKVQAALAEEHPGHFTAFISSSGPDVYRAFTPEEQEARDAAAKAAAPKTQADPPWLVEQRKRDARRKELEEKFGVMATDEQDYRAAFVKELLQAGEPLDGSFSAALWPLIGQAFVRATFYDDVPEFFNSALLDNERLGEILGVPPLDENDDEDTHYEAVAEKLAQLDPATSVVVMTTAAWTIDHQDWGTTSQGDAELIRTWYTALQSLGYEPTPDALEALAALADVTDGK